MQRNVGLAPFTTLGLGGEASYLIRARSITELWESVQWARENALPVLFLGGGSNLVVSDRGFDGLVVCIELRGMDFRTSGEHTLAEVAAGELWDDFVTESVHRNLAGIECLAGIPGSVGATPIQNVGAYGQEVSQVIERVDTIRIEDGEAVSFRASECDFAYRMSRFKREPGLFLITKVVFRLHPGPGQSPRYGELSRALGEPTPSVDKVRKTVLELRRAKGMVVDGEDPDSRSAGSFFTNPILSHAEAERVFAEALRIGVVEAVTDVPRYPVSDQECKLPAAWLIEKAGITKGLKHAGVGVSTKHTLALINRGEGSTTELVELALHIREKVRKVWGVTLEPEPVCVGFAQSPFSEST